MNHAPISNTPIAALSFDRVRGRRPGAAAPHTGGISRHDRQCVEDAVRANIAEHELGKLAEQRTASPGAKQFAERMASDHGEAGAELREAARAKGITRPARPKHAEKREMGELGKLSREQFDREYIDHMIKDHGKDAKEFREEAREAKDPDVTKFVDRIPATLEERLRMARQAKAALGGRRPAQEEGKRGRP